METDSEWPFGAWLKLAVQGFRLSPDEFWRMSILDWLTLTRADRMPTMSADELSALSLQFPDEVPHAPSRAPKHDTD